MHHHAPQLSKTTLSQGHSYRLDTIDLNWGDEHNLLPHSESIIYLSPSNLECQSIHNNLHLKIVWSKLSYQREGGRVQKWQTGRDLNICLLKMHRVSIEWQSSRPLKFRCPWLVFGVLNIWNTVYIHTPGHQSKSSDVSSLLHKTNLVVLASQYGHQPWLFGLFR